MPGSLGAREHSLHVPILHRRERRLGGSTRGVDQWPHVFLECGLRSEELTAREHRNCFARPTGSNRHRLRHSDGVESPGASLQETVEGAEYGCGSVGSTPVVAIERHLFGGNPWKLKSEFGVDPEVAPCSAARRPEQITVALFICVYHVAF